MLAGRCLCASDADRTPPEGRLLAAGALTYAGVTEAITGGIRQQDPDSCTPLLSALETLPFTTPFAVIAGANMWVLALPGHADPDMGHKA
ncbi:hypothetical protein [Rhodococcus sp. O3]|uniref:hypothetical protein n=1 Tax=Rhodococcus sp. O3 TaxID=3404919 RepID=UPI003B6702E9